MPTKIVDLSEMSFDSGSYKNQVSFDEPQLEFDEESLNIGAGGGAGPRGINGKACTSSLHYRSSPLLHNTIKLL